MAAANPGLALVQAVAIVLLGLVSGSVFGIWAGYDLTAYSPATFLESLQGAVRGLNVLLPALALAALALVVVLAVLGRAHPRAFWLYVAAAAAIAVAGLVTRLVNQPINGEIMGWTLDTLPANWDAVRHTWWNAHVVRLVVSVAAELLLLAAVYFDRPV